MRRFLLDPGPGVESTVARSLRSLHPRSAAERLHYVVPGEPGVPALREAARSKRRVAGGSAGNARPGHGRRNVGLQRLGSRRRGEHRLAVELQVELGAFDMVGNVSEWVADWGDLADGCTNWPPDSGSDGSCFGGPGSGLRNIPGAVFRRGDFVAGTDAGVFAVDAFFFPSDSDFFLGFRCAR